jgi:hypothetical protein
MKGSQAIEVVVRPDPSERFQLRFAEQGTKTTKVLGTSFRALRYRIKKLGIE